MTGRVGRSELTPALLVQAYRAGFFPMAEHRHGPISWFSPDPRAILPLSTLHVSRSLRQQVKKRPFEIRVNTAFEETMRGCAERDDTWISEEIITAYCGLHTEGLCHSVEAWQGTQLQGGLYGVAIGGAFFGESMFSRAPNASKIALLALVERLRANGFTLLDVQFMTSHLRVFGAVEIPRGEYLQLLSRAVRQKRSFSGDFGH